jgi:hypothetical protein
MKKWLVVLSFLTMVFFAGCSKSSDNSLSVQTRTAEQQSADMQQVAEVLDMASSLSDEIGNISDIDISGISHGKMLMAKKLASSLAKKLAIHTTSYSFDTTFQIEFTAEDGENFTGSGTGKYSVTLSSDEKSGSGSASFSLVSDGDSGSSVSAKASLSGTLSTASNGEITVSIKTGINMSAVKDSFDVAVKNAVLTAKIVFDSSYTLTSVIVSVSCPISALGGTYHGTFSFTETIDSAYNISYSGVSGDFYYGSTKIAEIIITDDSYMEFVDTDGNVLWSDDSSK